MLFAVYETIMKCVESVIQLKDPRITYLHDQLWRQKSNILTSEPALLSND
jgi:hypothetical protein